LLNIGVPSFLRARWNRVAVKTLSEAYPPRLLVAMVNVLIIVVVSSGSQEVIELSHNEESA
jgi:hypothetical protein